jgi:hypothetical protein
MGTLLFHICEATIAQCINNNPSDATAQDQCRKNNVCGTLNASSVPAASSSSVSSSASSTTSATASAASATKTSAAICLGQDFSVGIIAAVFLAAFGIML